MTLRSSGAFDINFDCNPKSSTQSLTPCHAFWDRAGCRLQRRQIDNIQGNGKGWAVGKDVLTLEATLPETNMAPENKPLEKEIPIGNHQF